ncbi:MAG: hypothetical protein NVS2B4_20210 [Ramlibacter sp.]
MAATAPVPTAPDHFVHDTADMQRPIPLPRTHLAASLVLAVVGVCMFAALVADLLLDGPVTRVDAPISNWFELHAQPWATPLMLALSAAHGTLGICALAAALAVALVLRHQSHWLPLLLVTVPGGLLLNALVKTVFHRARPTFEHPLVSLATSSFPSGHAAGATVWWGFVLMLWWAREPRPGRRALACGVAGALVLLVALSRVYLGAHYPSDVLAGIAEATAWVSLCAIGANALARRRAGAVAA